MTADVTFQAQPHCVSARFHELLFHFDQSDYLLLDVSAVCAHARAECYYLYLSSALGTGPVGGPADVPLICTTSLCTPGLSTLRSSGTSLH